MNRSLMFFSLAAMLLSATYTSTYGQIAKVQNFHGSVNQLQKTVSLAWWAAGDAMFISQIVETSADGMNSSRLQKYP